MTKTKYRGFRLPADVDASTRRAARELSQTQTAIIVQSLRHLMHAGILPKPPERTDPPGQLTLPCLNPSQMPPEALPVSTQPETQTPSNPPSKLTKRRRSIQK